MDTAGHKIYYIHTYIHTAVNILIHTMSRTKTKAKIDWKLQKVPKVLGAFG
jgi:hypothetical protein